MIIDYSKTKKTKHKYPQEQTDETQLLRVITTHTQEKIPSLRGSDQITYISGDKGFTNQK